MGVLLKSYYMVLLTNLMYLTVVLLICSSMFHPLICKPFWIWLRLGGTIVWVCVHMARVCGCVCNFNECLCVFCTRTTCTVMHTNRKASAFVFVFYVHVRMLRMGMHITFGHQTNTNLSISNKGMKWYNKHPQTWKTWRSVHSTFKSKCMFKGHIHRA